MWKMYIRIQIQNTHCTILGDNDVFDSIQFNGERGSIWQFKNISDLVEGLKHVLEEFRTYTGHRMLFKLNLYSVYGV